MIEGKIGGIGEIMKYFFDYQSELPAGVGFSLFGPTHLLWLGILTVIGGACLYFYRRRGCPRGMLLAVGLTPLALEVLRLAYLAVRGYLTVWELPLHLCGLSVFLCAVLALTRWDWPGQVLYGQGMPGALLALLFCDWTAYPAFSFVSANGFLSHGCIVLTTVLALVGGRIRPALHKIWVPFAFLLVVVPPVWWFDRAFGVNYFFLLRPAPDSPLDWLPFPGGSACYLLGYFGMALAVEFLLFFPWKVRKKPKN